MDHHLFSAAGELLLIYPKTSTFSAPLPVFEFSDTLRLWVVPFDLELGQLTIGSKPLK